MIPIPPLGYVAMAGWALSGVLLWGFINAKVESGAKDTQIKNFKNTINHNNITITQLQIDTQKYMKLAKENKEKIVVKYKTIKSDDTCEGKLNAINESLRVFYGY